MKFGRILRQSYRFWPCEINIADAKLQGEGGLFPTLSCAWSSAEAFAEDWSEEHRFMVWALFCALHEKARELAADGKQVLNKYSIDQNYLEKKYAESVLASWVPGHIRRSYIRDAKKRIGPTIRSSRRLRRD